MSKINVITPNNLGKGIKQDTTSKKWGVAIDGTTITLNGNGELQATLNAQPPQVTQVTQLASSQFFTQNSNGSFKFTELHEKPSFAKGLDTYLISEITGWDEVELTGLGMDQVNLWLKTYHAIFPFNDVHILQLNCEVYEVSDDISQSKGWGIKLPQQDKELVIKKLENKKTDVGVTLKLSLQEEKDVKRKYRIYYQIRVAERDLDSSANTDFTVVKPVPKDPVGEEPTTHGYTPTVTPPSSGQPNGTVEIANAEEPTVSHPDVTIMPPEDNHVDA